MGIINSTLSYLATVLSNRYSTVYEIWINGLERRPSASLIIAKGLFR
jgi:hypothetical protein